MTQGIVDKRNAKRKISHFPIRYRVLGKEDAPAMTAMSVDLSSKSVAFEIQELFQLGTRVEAELMVPSLPHTVKIKGKVNRIEETARKRYLHSILFEEIKKDDQAAIEKYVQLIDIDSILRLAIKRKASSLHMVSGQPPIFRIEGEIFHLDILPISAEDLKRMVLSMINEKQRALFNERLELDFSYFIPEGTRFRVNMFLDRGSLSAVFRIINNRIRTFTELGLPGIADDITKRRKGLIVVTRPVDSGKSTTLAAMIDSAVRLRVSSPVVLLRRLTALRRRGRAGVRQVERLLVDAGGESLLERQFLKLVRAAGLPRPITQARIAAHGQQVARVDFLFEAQRVVRDERGIRGAPVVMRTHPPGPGGGAAGPPANCSPRRSSQPSPAARSAWRNANPSIAELSKPGTAIRARTSPASTRPWARASARVSFGSRRSHATRSMIPRAREKSMGVEALSRVMVPPPGRPRRAGHRAC